MKFEIGDKRKEGLLSLDEVEAITITVKGIKNIIKEGIYDGFILIKYDKESTDSISIKPIINSSIAIR